MVVLQFSGGKDSLACLYLLRPFWDRITVMWANSGDAFPETIEQMAAIRELVPHFVEVNADQPAQVATHGYPADLLSAWDTPFGHQVEARAYKVQAPFHCCNENLWQPLAKATRELGATIVIRGQRLADEKKSPIRSGDIVDGVGYWFPLENWSDNDVVMYLQNVGVSLPEHYQYFNSSLDCQTCTAFLADNVGKFRYLRDRHPMIHADVVSRLQYIRRAAHAELDHLEACCGD